MNHLKTILSIAAFTAALAAFWLIPNINKAKTVGYARSHEETRPVSEKTIFPKAKGEKADTPALKANLDDKTPSPKKKHPQGSVQANYSFKEIEAKMYSRAIPFELEELELDTTKTDSTRLP